MAIQQIPQANFSGGTATVSEKLDVENSAKFIKNANIFEDPAYLTQARKTTKVSGATVTDLVHWAVDGSPWDTNRYFYSEGGKIYRETSGDVWSSLRTVSGGNGEGLAVFDNRLFYALATELGTYYPLDGTPAFQDSFAGWWIDSQLQTTGGGTGQADYVPPVAISEVATARQTFTATQDPVKSIVIDVDVVGTGDWTVTLHNTNNDSLGTSTIVNGSMAVGDNTFTLSSVARVKVNESYHFHVTSTVADGGVDTDVATDLEGAEFTANYAALISTTFHPMVPLPTGLVIGNEHYFAFFDGATYNPTKVELDVGYELRSMAKMDEFVVGVAWRGQSFAEAETAKMYFWDGVSAGLIANIDITIGSANAIVNYMNSLVGIYGNRGALYTRDGIQEGIFRKILDHAPKLARGKIVEIFPGAISEFDERIVVGISSSTDDGSALEQGVFEYGKQSEFLNDVLNFPYTISTGTTQGTTLKIGCVKSFGKDLYIGWRDDTTYGVDKVTAGDTAAATASWESRIFDNGDPNNRMQAIKVEIEFEALTSGQSVTPKYKLDRTASFTNGTAASTVGDTKVTAFINTVCKEAEWGFNLASTSNTFIKVKSVNFVYDDLSDEGLAAE
jgi:hypothetical protein